MVLTVYAILLAAGLHIWASLGPRLTWNVFVHQQQQTSPASRWNLGVRAKSMPQVAQAQAEHLGYAWLKATTQGCLPQRRSNYACSEACGTKSVIHSVGHMLILSFTAA